MSSSGIESSHRSNGTRPKDLGSKLVSSKMDPSSNYQLPQHLINAAVMSKDFCQQQNRRKKKYRNRRSVTLSPAAHFRRKWQEQMDDKSDSDSSGPLLSPVTDKTKRIISQRSISPFSPNIVKKKPDLPNFARRPPLRKTASEPTDLFIDECDRVKVEHIQDILNSLNFTKYRLVPNNGINNNNWATFSVQRTETLSPSASISSYKSGRSSPLITPSQSPDEIWETPRGSLLIPSTSRSAESGRRSSTTNSESSDFLGTDIEELRDAAQTIEALTRRSRRRPTDLSCTNADSRTVPTTIMTTMATTTSVSLSQNPPTNSLAAGGDDLSLSSSSVNNILVDDDDLNLSGILLPINNGHLPAMSGSATLPRRSGITARLGGQPRGVMQFLPSVKSSEFLSKTAYETYLANKSRKQMSADTISRSDSNYDDDTSISQYSMNGDLMSSNIAEPEYTSNSLTPHGRVSLPPTMPPSPALGYDLQFHNLRRKVSMPDRLYQMGHLFMPHSRHLDSVASQLALDDSSCISKSSTTSSYPTSNDITVLVPPKSPRFSSFRGNSTSASRNRKLQRQYSQHDKHLSDTEAYMVGPESPLKGVDSLGSFSRFGRLLRSLRTSRQNSPELNLLSPTSSDSPLSSPGIASSDKYPLASASTMSRIISHTHANATKIVMSQSWHGHVHDSGIGGAVSDSDSSMLQADLMLWQKRSKGSLRRHEDTRTHIVKELYDTEASYVENLQLLVHKYLRPLKRPELCSLIDPMLVDEIFFQIPEVLGHHELFFAALKSRLDNWDNRQKIGDIILNNFTKQSVIDTYTAFINNWKSAKQAIRAACQAKPAFAKYLERCSREHRNKLTLDALLIMPVQRIPRYELLIKELLKHTSVEHPDHPLLVRSQKEIHDLATKINHVEQEAGLSEQMQQRLREIEAIVDGLDDLVSPDRIFYRYDLVWVSTQAGKKERCMFLFSDQLIITNVKRKSAAALRKMPTIGSPSSCNFLESHKFKLLMKISLDDLEVTKNNSTLLNRIQDEISQLQEDLRVLGKVSELISLLKANKDDLEKEVDKLKDNIRRHLADKHHEMSTNPVLTCLDLLVTTEAGVESLTVAFQSADKRIAWEKCFNDAKEALVLLMTRRPPPIFMKCIAAQRTRAGLHFTCATPTLGKNEYGYPNVWVCNSDGYVGQVCVINLTPEPDLSSCNGITNSRILCICAIPDAKIHWLDFLTHSGQKKPSRKNSNATNSPISQDSGSAVDSGYNLELDSDSSDNESSAEGSTGKSSKSGGSANGSAADNVAVSTTALKQISGPMNGPNVVQAEEAQISDELVPTMWLGTEDGCIHIFNYNDSVRTRKNKTRVQHGSPVTSIVYVEDKVFASLASGVIIFYERDSDGTWNLEHHRTLELDVYQGHLTPLISATNKIWCGARNRVLVLNPHSLKAEHMILASSDTDSNIGCMVTIGLAVWLSMQSSPVIKLYHAHSYDCLLEINVSPTVTKVLAGCDDIIRQHKLSCLRITALLCCKDLLWIGTSAGVILQLPLPHVTHNTTRLSNISSLICAQVGHCGQCRFLTSVELHSSGLSASGSRNNSFNTMQDLSRRRMSLNVATLQQGKVYVISGGDGFEDFQDVANDDAEEITGKEDSTNHLLIWQV